MGGDIPHAKCSAVSNAAVEGIVISLARKKPKKQELAAAQSMTSSMMGVGPTRQHEDISILPE